MVQIISNSCWNICLLPSSGPAPAQLAWLSTILSLPMISCSSSPVRPPPGKVCSIPNRKPKFGIQALFSTTRRNMKKKTSNCKTLNFKTANFFKNYVLYPIFLSTLAMDFSQILFIRPLGKYQCIYLSIPKPNQTLISFWAQNVLKHPQFSF